MKYFRYTLDDLEKSANRKLFTYISFFAGGGGSSAGYKLAGGDCKFVNEFQQVAVDTYLANWPNTPHICDDIKNILLVVENVKLFLLLQQLREQDLPNK